MTFLVTMPAVWDDVPRIDQMMPQRLDVAFFGMGCFLGSEPRFGVTKGVWRTTVGYAGGRCESPSYDDTGDHIETVMIEYDPLVINYGQLLELFLLRHYPSQKFSKPQHASRIFVKNEFEKRLAQAALERYELCSDASCHTRIAMCRNFYEAEKWCQKYFLRTFSWLMQEMTAFYPDEDNLIRSPLATRLNGILGQSTPSSSLPEDIEFYDLSEHTLQAIKQMLT